MQDVSKPLMIGVAGPVASGKTTVINAIGEVLPSKIMSTSGALKAYCAAHGIAPTRQNLQDLGRNFSEEFGYKGFMHWVIEQSVSLIDFDKDHVVVDGIRNIDNYLGLKEKFPDAKLVYCSITPDEQVKRICARDQVSEDEARTIISHPIEQIAYQLEPMADFIYGPSSTAERISLWVQGLL